ncbi:HAMP domain-containing sensor histidine kinase [Ferruginibacter sp. HRS2-29]|uniref:sensor histidine kinase n=1 Tax=Ferruginibacter sp. HRS2-29 TaxID=2487334 RepID=UPI0020CBC229|nr:HAMP domain-containing sensor histidine kinase [Ferruginibacter sp. HRS2-29]
MIKLLNRPLKVFTLYALVILACSIPVYYFIAEYIWLSELDEHNRTVSGQLKESLLSQSPTDSLLEQNIAFWNKLQPVSDLKFVPTVKPDSIYTSLRKNKYIDEEEEKDRFRGLVSYVSIRDKNLQVTVESNVEETHETIIAITIITILFFILLFTGFVFLNRRISAGLWKPFYNTLDTVKAFELNKQEEVQFSQTNIIEFAELNASLEKLISKDIAVFREQKEFTENASHELQTPLAIIQSKLDLLMQSELSSEQSRLIEDTEKALGRISRINRNLLLLAKIGNNQFASTETIDLNALIEEQAGMLSDHLFTKKIILERDPEEVVEVNANRILVESMISNLLTNSIRHTASDGQIFIKLSSQSLMVINSGTTPLEKEKMFKRFSSLSSGVQGTGLGLSIVQQICRRYSWEVTYEFENGHHQFTVVF